jgi:hypothetical protein
MQVTTIFVKNGTPVGEQSKCASCNHAHILQGFRESEEIVYCAFVLDRPFQVPFKVRECSNYADKHRPTWEQMQDLAIEISPISSAKPAGFRRKRDAENEGVREEVAVETVNR